MADNVIRRGLEAEPLLNRALQEFSQDLDESAPTDQHTLPEKACSSVDQINDLTFVVIRNSQVTLAVYRVTSRGELKRLERWPKELE
jgi:hypothetical protein